MRRTSVAAGGAALLLAAAVIAVGARGHSSTNDPATAAPPGPVEAQPTTRAPGADSWVPKLITRDEGEHVSYYAYTVGRLVVTGDNCIALEALDGRGSSGIVWGYGFSAGLQFGRAVVYDPRGHVVAREGERVGLGGGASGRATRVRHGSHPCWIGKPFLAND